LSGILLNKRDKWLGRKTELMGRDLFMSQDEILDYLVKNKILDWFKAHKLHDKIGLSPTSITRGLKGLYHRGFIEKRSIHGGRFFEYKLIVVKKK
jgi:predicted transcriptional regulator